MSVRNIKMYGDVGIAEQQKVRKQAGMDGIKLFSIQHPTYFSHYTCIMICKMGLYTGLFYMPSSLLVFLLCCSAIPTSLVFFYTCYT